MVKGGRGRGVVTVKGGWSGCEFRMNVLMSMSALD